MKTLIARCLIIAIPVAIVAAKFFLIPQPSDEVARVEGASADFLRRSIFSDSAEA